MSDQVKLSNTYMLTDEDSKFAPDAVLIINKWMTWSKDTPPSQQIAARILSEIIAASEVDNGGVRCDWCGGLGGLFRIWRSRRDPERHSKAEDVCLWCMSDREEAARKEVGL